MGSDELKEAIRRLARGAQHPRPRLDMAPGCAYGAIVGERLQALEKEIAEAKTRLNGLIFVVVGAVVVQIILRLFA
ncbi:MAG: hypothetical protein HYX92_10620 [Chloroflexi bacterium]|nr:hypothetical protein [Chloroflexota bacterium]